MRRASIVLCSAALLGACAKAASPAAPAPQPVQIPIRPTSPFDAHWLAAVVELTRLEDRKEFDAVRLGGLLQDANADIRGRAAISIGRIGDRRGVPLLLSIAENNPAASLALGVLGDTSAAVMHALADNARRFNLPDGVFALGKLGGDSARAVLEE